jgi:flagellar hook-basal body complex protein FliE
MAITGIDPRMIAETIANARGAAASAAAEKREAETAAASGGGFGEVLTDAITRARAEESVANDMSSRFAAGDPSVGLHEVMIASEKSSIAVRYAVTVKNKAIEAYRELMNTPV